MLYHFSWTEMNRDDRQVFLEIDKEVIQWAQDQAVKRKVLKCPAAP